MTSNRICPGFSDSAIVPAAQCCASGTTKPTRYAFPLDQDAMGDAGSLGSIAPRVVRSVASIGADVNSRWMPRVSSPGRADATQGTSLQVGDKSRDDFSRRGQLIVCSWFLHVVAGPVDGARDTRQRRRLH